MTTSPTDFSPPIDQPPASTPHTARVALVGNPNTGKSTLFNRLTGIRQRTGNYPGITVEKHHGTLKLHGTEATLIDLPGCYSLSANSADERVVIDVLTGHLDAPDRPDLVLVVCDATNLLRNLYLASQIADIGLPLVIVINMIDEAHNQGIGINVERLSERLGVPAVTCAASRGDGVDRVRQTIEQALQSPSRMKQVDWPDAVHQAVGLLRQHVQNSTGQPASNAELHRLLFDDDSAIADRLGWVDSQREQQREDARSILSKAGHAPRSIEPVLRYGQLSQLTEGVIERPTQTRRSFTESVDRILTHRFWGLFIFAGLMWLVFESIYTWSQPLTGWSEAFFDVTKAVVGGYLASWPMVQSLVVDGVINGVGSVLVFLPQILILFFFVALLEDTGYMARAAYLMDRLFRWSGLNGKSFVPMLSSFACAVPGVMAARTIEDSKARLTTILIAPLMSCSARLPVYVLLISAFIEPSYGPTVAAATLFAMHLVGLAVAAPIAFAINRLLLKGQLRPFILELPRYHTPRISDVLLRMWDRGKEFIKTAGTIIVAMSIIIWALAYFPRPQSVREQVTSQFITQTAAQRDIPLAQARQEIEQDEGLAGRLNRRVDAAYMEQSVMGRMGKAVQPVFAPAGFDWKITVGIISAFPAREVIISSLGIIYSLGEVDEESEELHEVMANQTWPDGRKIFTVPVALAIMVFFALCSQCGATLATITREANWRWAVFSFTYMTVLAWIAAVAVYQAGSAILG